MLARCSSKRSIPGFWRTRSMNLKDLTHLPIISALHLTYDVKTGRAKWKPSLAYLFYSLLYMCTSDLEGAKTFMSMEVSSMSRPCSGSTALRDWDPVVESCWNDNVLLYSMLGVSGVQSNSQYHSRSDFQSPFRHSIMVLLTEQSLIVSYRDANALSGYQ